MDKYKKVKIIEEIQAVVSMTTSLIITPTIIIYFRILGKNNPFFDVKFWTFWTIAGTFLVYGLIMVILQIIKRVVNPPYRYSGPGRSGIGWGVGY